LLRRRRGGRRRAGQSRKPFLKDAKHKSCCGPHCQNQFGSSIVICTNGFE
jgi:hypothetical protein